MKPLLQILLASLFVATLTNCGHKTQTVVNDSADTVKCNSIYYWKTAFDIDSTDVAFLRRHDIKRIYLRMFDVAIEQDFLNGTPVIVPIATTKFASAVPEGIEIVPVTYITLDALREMAGKEAEFSSLIVDRLLAMATYNGCGEVKEIQLDCDWTSSTKSSYNQLCKSVKDSVAVKNIEVSATIRLHQLQETAPPVDRGVLMLYNTGALKNPQTKNSILHMDDASPYIKPTKYSIPLDYAYPVFGWGVKFVDNEFVSIVSADTIAKTQKEYIRYERPSVSEIMAIKELVEENLSKPAKGSILYHLDNTQLKNYTDDEISQIYTF